MSNTNAADRAHWAAQEQALATPDVFGDWFGAELMGADAQLELPPTPRHPDGDIDLDLHGKPVAHLYMLAIDGGQPKTMRLAALDEISRQYLSAKDDYVRQIALEMLERREVA